MSGIRVQACACRKGIGASGGSGKSCRWGDCRLVSAERSMNALRRRLLLFAERTCWALGLAGLAWWGTFHVDAALSTRHHLDRFAALREVTLHARIPDQPLAVLRIPKVGLEVPVLRGTDPRTLDRAVGHIEGTTEPGKDGNSGIAGHRDGFFRGLKNIAAGDTIELDTLEGTDVYRVERTWVVKPQDVSVLDPTPIRALTLVTCYPFYFSGPAPKRFIVRAVLHQRAGVPAVPRIRSLSLCGRSAACLDVLGLRVSHSGPLAEPETERVYVTFNG